MAPPIRHAIQEAVASGVGVVIQWALPLIVLAFLVSFLLREVPLRDDVNVGAAAVEGMEEAGFGVLGEPGPRGMDDGHNQVRLTGVAEVVTERPLLQEIWDANPLMRQFLGSLDNPQLIVYRIRPVRVRFMQEWALEYHEVPFA